MQSLTMNEDLTPLNDPTQQGNALLSDLRQIIRSGKSQAVVAVNSALTLTFGHVGKRINEEVLQGERAAYGKKVIPSLARELVERFGKSFEARNLHRTMQFAELFPDFEIVKPLASQLSWTHFVILLMQPKDAARHFYARQSIEHLWSKSELTRQIERKAFERAEIADSKLEFAAAPELAGAFKDPYFSDSLSLPDGYLENKLGNNLEQALSRELEQFILELGKGFAFVERQKRMIFP
jgi:predicted nuclease of restriction endonuclease-like (RecB) superfamily